MNIRIPVLFCLGAAFALGQQTIPEDPAGPERFGPLTLASEFFQNDYFNYYGFVNGAYDSYAPTLNNQGQSNSGGAFGYAVGGGLSAFHRFRRGSFGLSYTGSYQDYQSSFFASGTNQNLNFSYGQQLSRRWSIGASVGAGILFYGNGYLGSQPNSGTYIQANPFSTQTRFVSAGLTLSYLITRRLSVYGTGGFFLQRYNFASAVGSTGGSGGGGVSYRVTARTTVNADYSHGYYKYQRGSGDTTLNTITLGLFHRFPGNYLLSLSGGITHSNVSGFVNIPLSLLVGNQGVGGYVIGNYRTSSNLPAFSGTLTKAVRRQSFTIGAGQSVVSGNGYYLASRNQYVNGGYSRTYLRSNFSAGVNYYRLKSVANAVEVTYNTFALGAGYGYSISRHISANARYDFLRYGSLAPLNSISDNRISFGLSISSKSIPLTLF